MDSEWGLQIMLVSTIRINGVQSISASLGWLRFGELGWGGGGGERGTQTHAQTHMGEWRRGFGERGGGGACGPRCGGGGAWWCTTNCWLSYVVCWPGEPAVGINGVVKASRMFWKPIRATPGCTGREIALSLSCWNAHVCRVAIFRQSRFFQ